MHAETAEQVRVLRSLATAERTSLEDLERRFNHHTMKKMVQRAMAELDDVEMFLRLLDSGGRTVSEELSVIHSAHVPYQWAIQKRNQLEQAMKSYGPDAMLIPDPLR